MTRRKTDNRGAVGDLLQFVGQLIIDVGAGIKTITPSVAKRALRALKGEEIELEDPIFIARKTRFTSIPEAVLNPKTGELVFVGVGIPDLRDRTDGVHIYNGIGPLGKNIVPDKHSLIRVDGLDFPQGSSEPIFIAKSRGGYQILFHGNQPVIPLDENLDPKKCQAVFTVEDDEQRAYVLTNWRTGGEASDIKILRQREDNRWEEIERREHENIRGFREVGGKPFFVEELEAGGQTVHWGDWSDKHHRGRVLLDTVCARVGKLRYITREQGDVDPGMYYNETKGVEPAQSRRVLNYVDTNFIAANGRIFWTKLESPKGAKGLEWDEFKGSSTLLDVESGHKYNFVTGDDSAAPRHYSIGGVIRSVCCTFDSVYFMVDRGKEVRLIKWKLDYDGHPAKEKPWSPSTRAPFIRGATGNMRALCDCVAIEVERDGQLGVVLVDPLDGTSEFQELFGPFDRLTDIDGKDALSWHTSGSTLFLTRYSPPEL